MDNIMTDEELEKALDELAAYADNDIKRTLAQLMNENQIISWEEAEQILADTGDEPIKCSLPQQVRPTEPDNDTNVDQSIQSLLQNDPKMNTVNLNNLKRTPIPQIKRIIMAMKDNEYIEKLSLANMGLYDKDVEPLIEVLEDNESLRVLNLETNYLSGEFFARLFQAALKNQTLEEIKAVNQGVSFSTESERAMIKAIFQNRGLLKISVNFRLPEGRHKVEQTTMRNQEIRRILRRQAAEEARLEEERKKAEQMPKPEPKPQPKKPPPVIVTAPSMLKLSGAPLKSENLPKPEEPPRILAEVSKVEKIEPEIPKWRRPKPEEPPKILADTSKTEKVEPEIPKWKRPKAEEPPRILAEASNTEKDEKAEPEVPKWRRPKPEEPPKTEIPKWRRPKPEEPGTSIPEKKPLNSTASDNKPSTSNKEQNDVEKPSKKTPLAIPPIILGDIPSFNGVNKLPKEPNPKPDTSKFEKSKRLIIAAPDSSMTGLTIPKETLLTTSTATSATESDAVSSTSSKPKKKKIIRRKKKKPVPLPEKIETEKTRDFNDHLEVIVDYPEPEAQKEKIQKEEIQKEEIKLPKKKIVRKKKKVEGETDSQTSKLNGSDLKNVEESKPMGVFPRSRLISANKQ